MVCDRNIAMAGRSNTPAPTAQHAVPLPSADLIQYRFDQLDDKMASFDQKLERLISGGITKADVLALSSANDKRVGGIETEVEAIKTDMDKVKGAIALLKVFSVLLTLIAALIGSLWWIKG